MTGKDAEMSKVDEAPETPVTDGEAETPVTDEVGSKIRLLPPRFFLQCFIFRLQLIVEIIWYTKIFTTR